MNSFITHLKDQVTVLNFLLLLLIAAAILRRLQKRKTAILLTTLSVIFFLLSSTTFLPRHLIRKLESRYQPLPAEVIKGIKGKVFVHVLGSGYSVDKDLPPNIRLGIIANSRLLEAVRIYRLADSAILVGSASAPADTIETQAQVLKSAAIALGVPDSSIITLNKPTTTWEEATELQKKLGSNLPVIVVTDAMHMPRAMRFFKAAGFKNIYAAPVNYKFTGKSELNIFSCLPSAGNLVLSDKLLHEYFGSLKEGL